MSELSQKQGFDPLAKSTMCKGRECGTRCVRCWRIPNSPLRGGEETSSSSPQAPLPGSFTVRRTGSPGGAPGGLKVDRAFRSQGMSESSLPAHLLAPTIPRGSPRTPAAGAHALGRSPVQPALGNLGSHGKTSQHCWRGSPRTGHRDRPAGRPPGAHAPSHVAVLHSGHRTWEKCFSGKDAVQNYTLRSAN